MNIKQIAAALGVATSTVHRWLNEGIIAGEQLTPGAPWRIRLTDDLAPVSLKKHQMTSSPCIKPCVCWEFLDKQCGNVSSAARSKRFMSDADAKKACASRSSALIRPLRSNCTSWGVV